jgi:hypothetical protein
MAEDTRRAALEAAFDKQIPAEAPPPAEPPPVEAPPEAAAPEAAPPTQEKPRDNLGRFAKSEEAPTEEAPPKAPEKAPVVNKPLTAADTQKPPVEAAPAPPKAQEGRPPVSWRPAEREAWGQVPKAARDAVERREREIEHTLRETAQARQGWERFREAVRPYEQIMAMNGTTDPVQSVSNLMRTAALLQMGSDYQKAGTIAQVITQYGINPELVGAYLSGQAPMGQPQQPPRDPRLDVLIARLEEAKQQSQQAMETRLEREVAKFAETADWFEDVREPMADLIEVWVSQGKVDDSNLTEAIKKAYDIAVRADEGIAQAVRQREEAERAKSAQEAADKAKAAASSVKSQPTVGPGGPPTKGRRATLEHALDEQISRRRA